MSCGVTSHKENEAELLILFFSISTENVNDMEGWIIFISSISVPSYFGYFLEHSRFLKHYVGFYKATG